MPPKPKSKIFADTFFLLILFIRKITIQKSALEFDLLSNEKDASYNYRSYFFIPNWHCYNSNTILAKHAVVKGRAGKAKSI